MIVPSISSKTTLVTLLSSVILALYLRRRSKYVDESGAAAPVDKLQGPPPGSWLMGNFITVFIRKKNPQDEHMNLVRRFGLAFRVKSVFNNDVLYLADPKGLQYVLNTSGYNYAKPTRFNKVLLGKNILGVEGEEHARQRRMLLPSFSQSHMHEIVPAFVQVTSKLVEQWKDMIANKEGRGIDVNMCTWLSSVTLDAFGQGVLSYDFGALSDKPTEYVQAVRGLFVDMFKNRTNAQLLAGIALGRTPEFIGRFLVKRSLSGGNRFDRFLMASNEICSSIIEREKEAIALGKPPSKDLLSILVRANMNLHPKLRLSDDELMSQMHAFTVAGHDTTASQLNWVFYELSHHPEAQAKIREEIKLIKEARGIQELGPSELESLSYTAAVVKESLRFHPIAFSLMRTSARDDIIPLACSVKDASGRKEVNGVYVKKGQEVFISLLGYNFVKELWGADADEWVPERFLNEREVERSKRTLGVYAHLATFSSGVHACIAWRFALLEMLAVVTGLVEHFEFAPTTSNPTVVKRVAATVYPCIEGEEKPHMPLSVRPISE